MNTTTSNNKLSRQQINDIADEIYNTTFPGPIREDTANQVRNLLKSTFSEIDIVSYGYGRVVLRFNEPPHRSLTKDEQEVVNNGVALKIAYNKCATNDDGSLQNGTEVYCWRDTDTPIKLCPILDHQKTGSRPNWVLMPYREDPPEKEKIEKIVSTKLERLPISDDLYSQSSWGKTESGELECIDYGRFDP